MSVQIYVSFVRRRVETPKSHYTNTSVKLTIVTHLSFSERIAIAKLSFQSDIEPLKRTTIETA